MKKQGFTTNSLNIPYPKKDPHNSLQIPLYETVAFEFDSAEQIEANFKGEYNAHVYSRASSPTVEYFELKMIALLLPRIRSKYLESPMIITTDAPETYSCGSNA